MQLLPPRVFLSVIFILLLQTLAACSSGSGGSAGGDCKLGSSANVIVDGTVTFDLVPHNSSGALDHVNTAETSSKGVTVEAVCNTVIASTSTDANGDYSLQIPGETSNVFIRVKAEMKTTGTPAWDFTVVDNTQAQALYSMSGAKFNSGTQDSTRDLRAASGWTGASYGNARVAAPFAILNSVYAASQKVLAADATVIFPPLKINWSTNNVPVDGNVNIGQISTSFYSPSSAEIFLLGDEAVDTDEYDEHVVIHEWAHYFEDKFSRTDSLGGLHSGGDRLDMRVAFGEGFGNAFSAIATDNPVYSDSLSPLGMPLQFNIDSNNSCINSGWFSECSVHTILYDLYDSADEGSVDVISLGFAPIYSVLVNGQKNTVALTSIFSFITELRKNKAANIQAAINNLVAGPFATINGIADEFGTGETNSAGKGSDVIPIYTGITADSTANSLCVISDFREIISTANGTEYFNGNRLSSYRFLEFVPPLTKNYTITATKVSGAGNDPDIVLFQRGSAIASALSTQSNTENLSTGVLNAGATYIIQINDAGVTFSTSAVGKTCFNVTVSN